MKPLLAAIAILSCMMTQTKAADGPVVAPDLVIVDADVRTMDAARPTAEALAILGNRIAAVGTSREIRASAGPNARVIEGSGRLVLPGFNDAHVHFLEGGFSLAN